MRKRTTIDEIINRMDIKLKYRNQIGTKLKDPEPNQYRIKNRINI